MVNLNLYSDFTNYCKLFFFSGWFFLHIFVNFSMRSRFQRFYETKNLELNEEHSSGSGDGCKDGCEVGWMQAFSSVALVLITGAHNLSAAIAGSCITVVGPVLALESTLPDDAAVGFHCNEIINVILVGCVTYTFFMILCSTEEYDLIRLFFAVLCYFTSVITQNLLIARLQLICSKLRRKKLRF